MTMDVGARRSFTNGWPQELGLVMPCRHPRNAALAVAIAILALLVVAPAGAQSTGSTAKPILGVQGSFTPAGMLIGQIVPGSAAESAGLVPGDLILKMDEQIIRGPQDINRVLNASGGLVMVFVRRAGTGALQRVTVDLSGLRVAPYLLGVRGTYTAQGMLVASVGQGMAAGRIGIRPGDLIARINGRVITSQTALFQALYDSGGQVDLAVLRGGIGQAVNLHAFLQVYQLGVLGDYTPQGMTVAIVAPETPAARAGLKRGDVIATIDGKAIANQTTFDAALKRSGGRVVLQVRRGAGAPGRLEVNLMNSPLGAWTEAVADGMRVAGVAEGTPAARAGLKTRDVILRVEDRQVKTQDSLLRALDGVRGQTNLGVRLGQTGRVVQMAVDLTRP
jgi:S1-C subfamily serine protease